MSRDQMPWDDVTDEPADVAPRSTNAPRRAAVAMWVTAAVQLVLFGGCALMITAVGLAPEDMLREGMTEQVSEEQLDQLVQAQPAMLISALILLLVMFLPALVLLLLGFAVRRSSLPAIRTARVILLLQAAIVAVMLVIYALGGIVAGDVVAMCMSGLLLGGVLALIVWTLRALGDARRAHGPQQGYDNEPWNEPLT